MILYQQTQSLYKMTNACLLKINKMNFISTTAFSWQVSIHLSTFLNTSHSKHYLALRKEHTQFRTTSLILKNCSIQHTIPPKCPKQHLLLKANKHLIIEIDV